MKFLILAFMMVAQTFSFAIPTPTYDLVCDSARGYLCPMPTWSPWPSDLAKRQSILQVYEVLVPYIIGKIKDAAAPSPLPSPGPDAPQTSVASAGKYDRLIRRTTALSGWTDTIYEDLIAMEITPSEGNIQKGKILDFLDQNIDLLPHGWEDLPVPIPCPSCFALKNKFTKLP